MRGEKMNVAYNTDCFAYMRNVPDKHFDLTVADPPYGINVTAQHPEHTHTHTQRRLSEAEGGPLAVKRAKVYGKNKRAFSSQNFIPCLTIAPRQTQRFSGSWNE